MFTCVFCVTSASTYSGVIIPRTRTASRAASIRALWSGALNVIHFPFSSFSGFFRG